MVAEAKGATFLDGFHFHETLIRIAELESSIAANRPSCPRPEWLAFGADYPTGHCETRFYELPPQSQRSAATGGVLGIEQD
jgi:hypothetical protein